MTAKTKPPEIDGALLLTKAAEYTRRMLGKHGIRCNEHDREDLAQNAIVSTLEDLATIKRDVNVLAVLRRRVKRAVSEFAERNLEEPSEHVLDELDRYMGNGPPSEP
jgi:hypothetical protein